MTTKIPATAPAPTPDAINLALAEAYATDSLFDYLTDANAQIMGIIVSTIQWPILTTPNLLRSRPGSKHWLKMVFNAVQWLRPNTTLDAKLKLVAEIAIELRTAMTDKEWFEFLCEEADTLQGIHPSVLTQFANHLLETCAASKDENLLFDLMGFEIPKKDILYVSGPLPIRLLVCLHKRNDLASLFRASAYTNKLGRLVMKHQLRGLETILNLSDLAEVFSQDLGL
ncbi:hypothetical protein [Pseudomonas serbica]|jgi:hypothetical protein|uniref:hypothetical protein n=1 Tax=Pseudomonas serbica TaxID=2965074 RepID=UPI00237A3122|nr:hypothetical protein [Pseudomonas serbica]